MKTRVIKDERETLSSLREHKENHKIHIDKSMYSNILDGIEILGRDKGFPVYLGDLKRHLRISETTLRKSLKILGVHVENGYVF